jgi:hypothetical protein
VLLGHADRAAVDDEARRMLHFAAADANARDARFEPPAG